MSSPELGSAANDIATGIGCGRYMGQTEERWYWPDPAISRAKVRVGNPASDAKSFALFGRMCGNSISGIG